MRKVLFFASALVIMAYAKDCFILEENTIGTINEELLVTVKQSKQKEIEAIKNNQAYLIKAGEQACNTNKSNFGNYSKQIIFNNKILWIDDRVKVEIIK